MTDTLGMPTANLGTSQDSFPALLASLPANATDAQMEQAAMAQFQNDPKLQQYIQDTYGYVGAYLATVPELTPILITAGVEHWDQARFDGAVMKTQWWRTTAQAARNWQEISANDPASAQLQLGQAKNTVRSIAQSLGVSLSDQDLSQTATAVTAWGLSTTDITQVLRASPASKPSQTFGDTATFADRARQLAGQYAVALPDSALAGYVQQNLQGKLSADGLQNVFAAQAAALYPWMAPSIAQGVAPQQFLSSYASAAGTTLGMDASDVNWTDPKWMKALLTTSAGQPAGTPVDLGTFQQNLMRNPVYGYQYTKGARDQAYAMADTIAQQFGKVAR